jgi:hypothetical protein
MKEAANEADCRITEMKRLKDLGFKTPEIAAEKLRQILYSTATQSERVYLSIRSDSTGRR